MTEDKKKCIMVVEDDLFVRDIYVTKIMKEGFDLVSASDGMEALKKLEEEGVRPDLILLDIIMPKLDGLSVLKRIKANPELEKIPIILLTNLGQRDQLDKAAEFGVNDYLIKSHFTPSEVMEKINKFLI
jgi:CheY-like chemotaxis protein